MNQVKHATTGRNCPAPGISTPFKHSGWREDLDKQLSRQISRDIWLLIMPIGPEFQSLHSIWSLVAIATET